LPTQAASAASSRTAVPAEPLTSSRVSFWKRKFEQNVARDKVVRHELRKLGWKVVLVWQCQAEKPDRLLRRLGKMLPVPEPMKR